MRNYDYGSPLRQIGWYGPNDGPNRRPRDGVGLAIFLLILVAALLFGTGFLLMNTDVGALCGGG